MIGSKMEPGSKVMIVEDCRDGGTATGQIGIFEGEFPLSVALGTRSNDGEETKWRGEYDYSAYKNGAVLPGDNRPAKDIYLEWEGGKPQPVPHFAMVMKNPRIKLPDGSAFFTVHKDTEHLQ